MTWRIRWTRSALGALKAMPWPHAAAIDRAVMRLAAAGEGADRVEGAPHLARLRVGSYAALLELDPAARVIVVLWVLRS